MCDVNVRVLRYIGLLGVRAESTSVLGACDAPTTAFPFELAMVDDDISSVEGEG
jgi:hypothetical protein